MKDIIEGLNHSYDKAMKSAGELTDELTWDGAPNLLFCKNKTTEDINVVIEDWARENGVNLYIVTGNGYEIKRNSGNVTIGYLTAKYIAPTSEEIAKLNAPKTVLLLKNVEEMTNKTYRRFLLDMMNDHIVADDSKEEKYTVLSNLLFVVATIEDQEKIDLFEFCTMDAKDGFMQIDV